MNSTTTSTIQLCAVPEKYMQKSDRPYHVCEYKDAGVVTDVYVCSIWPIISAIDVSADLANLLFPDLGSTRLVRRLFVQRRIFTNPYIDSAFYTRSRGLPDAKEVWQAPVDVRDQDNSGPTTPRHACFHAALILYRGRDHVVQYLGL